MFPPNLDPTHFTALQSLTMPDILSPDGRAHPMNADTPVSVENITPTVVPPGTQTGPVVDPTSPTGIATAIGAAAAGSAANGGIGGTLLGLSLPAHLGARAVVAVVAIGLLLIVAWRFST